MNYKYVWIFAFFLFIGSIFASEKESSKELLSDEELESTIMFLEDSQKINELVSRLRAIRDARKIAGIDTAKKRESVSTNLLFVFDTFKKGVIQKGVQIRKEMISVPQKFSKINAELLKEGNLERFYSLLIVLLIATIAGGLVGVFLWRNGEYLRKIADKEDQKYQKLAGITACLLKKSAFSLSLIGMGLVFLLIPVSFELNTVINKILLALLVYVAACGAVNVVWNRKYPLFSFSNEASSAVIRNLLIFIRFSLVVYIFYCFTRSWLPGVSVILSFFYKLVIIFWIPSLLKKYRYPISQWFTTESMERKALPKVMVSVIKNILLRINHISFLFLLLITLIWLAGYKDVYEKITVGVLLSCLIMAGAIILMVLWNSILLNFNRSFSKDSVRISELSEFLARNIVIIRRAGLICIVGITAVVILQVWGIGAGGVLNFENNYLRISLRVISILIGAFVLIQLTKVVVERLKKEATIRMQSSNVSCTIEIEKRVATMSNIIQKMVMGGVVLFAVIMVMDELGFDIKAMLAGVGVIGLAVGFGAQNLVRDIISGLFLIFENRIRVGDVAIINGTGGSVVQVNLRTTVLRSLDGTVHVFPNGSINSLSNMTHEFSFYVFEISVCYNENVDRVIKALKEVGEEIISDPDFKDAILEPLEIQGVDRFAESALIIKARIKTLPIKQWYVGREMNLRIKRKFDKEGIRIALPHRTLYFGEMPQPFSLRLEGSSGITQERNTETRDGSLEGVEG